MNYSKNTFITGLSKSRSEACSVLSVLYIVWFLFEKLLPLSPLFIKTEECSHLHKEISPHLSSADCFPVYFNLL